MWVSTNASSVSEWPLRYFTQPLARGMAATTAAPRTIRRIARRGHRHQECGCATVDAGGGAAAAGAGDGAVLMVPPGVGRGVSVGLAEPWTAPLSALAGLPSRSSTWPGPS